MRPLPIAFTVLIICFPTLFGCGIAASESDLEPGETLTIEVLITGLDNPRGIAVSQDGELFVAEAGTGYATVDPTQMTGKLTLFVDQNGDGDFDD